MVLRRCLRHPRTLSLAAAAVVVSGLAHVLPVVTAAPRVPRVVDVPSRPAFVRPQAAPERPALVGQVLGPATVLRTENPGRLQILLADGRNFRLGGNALLRIEPSLLDLVRGRIIAWIDPGSKGTTPLRVRTRVGTASIQGTTVFIEDTSETVLFLSWEGDVEVRANDGTLFRLTSGQRLEATPQGWKGPHRMEAAETRQRRRNSELLNGFEAPMQTLPVIERELGLSP
ncbi:MULTISPECIES: FecR family protein [unclassified Cyanobium]|uniref:FecR family protein n=1 Tax=unclassified Cyanobium TaxID=2627006 RepID=UPI0020CD9903|nr:MULTISPECIES: FecR family protein [unclassified Cyanobium]MCP9833986.1 FecR domain-containing protein [Cyanobium sp. La Preciosa 7G6]MCP9936749.1 FecR domain-containing protein [Cyanobium sp. Aljojuca 7A6]